MAPGRVRYGLICAEDGGVIDDILVSREAEDAFHVVVNASNHSTVLDRWSAAVADDVTLEDLTDDQAMIALQGPQSVAVLQAMGGDDHDLSYYQFVDTTLNGVSVRLSRTGYTGEDGFEIFAAPADIVQLWNAACAAGAEPCGLGARDTPDWKLACRCMVTN